MEVFLAPTWEQTEEPHGPWVTVQRSKILEPEDQGKGDRRTRTGYDLYPRSRNHFVGGKEGILVWFCLAHSSVLQLLVCNGVKTYFLTSCR